MTRERFASVSTSTEAIPALTDERATFLPASPSTPAAPKDGNLRCLAQAKTSIARRRIGSDPSPLGTETRDRSDYSPAPVSAPYRLTSLSMTQLAHSAHPS